MRSCVALLVALAAVSVTIPGAAAMQDNQRFASAAPTEKSIPALTPGQRATPIRWIEPIQRSDSAALLLPQAARDIFPPAISKASDTPSSLGKITTASVSKMVVNVAKSTDNQAKSGENNPLLAALQWRGATASQIGVPNELWCADFINYILRQTGHPTTDSRAARSFLKYGKRIDGPRVGAIVVFTRGSNPNSGHVGIVRGTDGNGNPIVVSGNHNNKVAESVYPKERVLGYFVP